MGYIQAIDSNGIVIAQAKSSESHLSHYRDNVWKLKDGDVIKYAETSIYTHLDKFLAPVPCDADIKLYPLDFQNPSSEPVENPSFVFKATELEDKDIENLTGLSGWNAYFDGEWIGTSEY